MKAIGYIRTSTGEQTGAAQRHALSAHGCETIFHDRGVSGGAVIKPQLDAALAACESGDAFVVTAYDRLARSLVFLSEDVKRIHDANVEFVSLREQIDTQEEFALACIASGVGQWSRRATPRSAT